MKKEKITNFQLVAIFLKIQQLYYTYVIVKIPELNIAFLKKLF